MTKKKQSSINLKERLSKIKTGKKQLEIDSNKGIAELDYFKEIAQESNFNELMELIEVTESESDVYSILIEKFDQQKETDFPYHFLRKISHITKTERIKNCLLILNAICFEENHSKTKPVKIPPDYIEAFNFAEVD